MPAIRLALPALMLGLFLVAGCTPNVTAHGTPMTRIESAEITPGVDTRGSVRRQLGQPTMSSLIAGETWFYVSTIMEQRTYHAAEVVDRRVLAVAFDDAGVVVSANRYGLEDGQLVALRTETTPTFGRELTVAQQLFGNLGRVGPGQLGGRR